jgi:RNA polymerase sigma-70 factor, ECF subfamily
MWDAAGPSDQALIDRFRGGDEAAFTALVERHERRVYNLAYRILGRAEDAREASQDAFLSCFRNLSRFRGDAAFTTWLHRIAVNACYDMLRRRQPIPFSELELVEPPPAPDHAEAAAAAVDVHRALQEVPIEFRAVIVMYDLHGMPYEEIAQALEVPLGTVKSRLHRGRVALGRALGAPSGIAGTTGSTVPVQATDPTSEEP